MEKLTKILQHKILLTATIIVSVVVVAMIVGLLMAQPEELLQGQAETTDYRVSSKVPSRVVRLLVREGQRVHGGDTLVVLASPEMDAERRRAVALYESVKALEENINLGTREEKIQAAYEGWQRAKAMEEIAEKTFQRIDNLYREGVETAQKHDEALARRDAARAEERRAKAKYDLQLSGSRSEEKRAAHSQSDAARAAIGVVDAMLGETVLTAQADGVVTEIFPEEGELVGIGAPIMNVATDDVWFTFNLREDQLPGIELGNRMTVYLPATAKDVDVEVTLIKNVGNFAAWKATRALEGIDLKVFEVQMRPVGKVSHVHEGMSAILRR